MRKAKLAFQQRKKRHQQAVIAQRAAREKRRQARLKEMACFTGGSDGEGKRE